MAFNKSEYFRFLGGAVGREIFCLESVDSTNTYLKNAAASVPDLSAATAEEQTRGRGRFGRSWQVRPEKSLALSVLFSALPAGTAGRMPVFCAVAAVRAVLRVSGVECGIKWPNDIVFNRQKLMGILCESSVSANKRTVVCGFGLNLTQTPEEFIQDGLPYAVSLKTACGREIRREEAAAALCTALGDVLRRQADDILAEYRRRCINIGLEVSYTSNGAEYKGICTGISEDGALLVKNEQKTAELHSGEVSLTGFYEKNNEHSGISD